jgi:hypothetical protein
MSEQEFTSISNNIISFLRPTDLETNTPIEYRINCTYLENITNENMIIDSCYNILLQARNTHVRVNNKMGIGLDASSAYSLHVLGNSCISGDIITSGNIFSKNIYSNDLSVNTINGQTYNYTPLKFYNNNWNKLGIDISLIANSYSYTFIDSSTNSLEMSNDGKKLFMGARGSTQGFTNNGLIFCYSYNDISNTWNYHSVIIGKTNNEDIASSRFKISNDGNRIIFCTMNNFNVRIYRYTSEWLQIEIDITSMSNFFAISGNGDIVAITKDNSSIIFYSINSSNTLTPYPPSIPNQSDLLSKDGSNSVRPKNTCLSHDGLTISIGFLDGPSGTANGCGSVRVFKFIDTYWITLTTIVLTPSIALNRVYTNSLSQDGLTLAIANMNNNSTGPNSGAVYIYKYNSTANNYIRLGQTIFPDEEWTFTYTDNIYFGSDIKLSGDGNTIIVGAISYKYLEYDSVLRGACFIYKYNPNNNYWSQLGQRLWGTGGERLGTNVTISYDGATIAFGGHPINRYRAYGINNISLDRVLLNL